MSDETISYPMSSHGTGGNGRVKNSAGGGGKKDKRVHGHPALIIITVPVKVTVGELLKVPFFLVGDQYGITIYIHIYLTCVIYIYIYIHNKSTCILEQHMRAPTRLTITLVMTQIQRIRCGSDRHLDQAPGLPARDMQLGKASSSAFFGQQGGGRCGG